MKIAYFDCFAGAGGDMIVAAMLDAGLDAKFLKAQLATLGLRDLDIKITETKRAGIRAVSFKPFPPEQDQPRNLQQITKIIQTSKISQRAKNTAVGVFQTIAQAEAAVHNKNPNDIHFHEVGAIDSIVDIVSASIGMDSLRIEKVHCSALSVGGGSLKCAHGLMPIPAPATAQLLKGVPITAGPTQAELLTPTAAAILTTIVDQFGPLPAMKIETVGYGAGSMQFDDFPNVLRLILGQTTPEASANADTVCLLETNVDDISGELIGFISQDLLRRGALDVFTAPVYMKQNRPAVQISVICKAEDATRFEQALFQQGLTFGIRKQLIQRSKLTRDFVAVQTDYGQIRIKTALLNGKIVNAKPEFSDCVSAAEKHDVPVRTVVEAAMTAYKNSSAHSN